MSTMEQRERYESLYTATTQHLLVRDFDSAGSCVLDLLSSRPKEAVEDEIEKITDGWEQRLRRWTMSSEDEIKAYKLYAFVIGSKHGERLESIVRSSSNSTSMTGTLDLKDMFDGVITAYSTESAPTRQSSDRTETPGIPDLHPSILQTILLSLLKLSTSYPYAYSESLSPEARDGHPLSLARGFVERWLAGLEDDSLKALSFPKKFLSRSKTSNVRSTLQQQHHHPTGPDGRNNASPNSIGTSNPTPTDSEEWTYYTLSLRLSGMNKSYRSLLKTYALEILPRFGDWELSREMILQGLFPKAEEQEKLLKKLHALQVQHEHLQRSMHSSTSDLGRSVSSLSSSMDASHSEGDFDAPGIRSDRNSGSHSDAQRDPPVSRMARPPSPSAASVQTDKTIRAGDYMKGRGGVGLVGRGSGPQRKSGSGGETAEERGGDEGEKETSIGSTERRTDEESVVGSTRSLTQGSARFGHAAFETLRARIVRYLDTPIDQDPHHEHEHDVERRGQEEGPDRRPRARRSLSISRRTRDLVKIPLHQRLSNNFGFRLIVRALSLMSIVLFLLSLVRRRQRRRALANGGVVRDVDVMQEVREAVGVVRDKVVAVFRMGTTISYV